MRRKTASRCDPAVAHLYPVHFFDYLFLFARPNMYATSLLGAVVEWSRRNTDSSCRRCGAVLAPVPVGRGRPRELCDQCRQPGRSELLPDWSSNLVKIVQRDYPDTDDPFIVLLHLFAALLSGAQDARDVVPLSREFSRLLKDVDARGKGRPSSDALDALRARREVRMRL